MTNHSTNYLDNSLVVFAKQSATITPAHLGLGVHNDRNLLRFWRTKRNLSDQQWL